MAISEEARHELYTKLEALLGRAEATTLMEHLPPVGWADVATRRDLDQLEGRMDMRFAAVGQDLGQLEGRMDMRFAAMGKVLERLEERMDLRFAATQLDVEQLEVRVGLRLTAEANRLEGIIATGLESLEKRFEAKLGSAIAAQTRVIIFTVLASIGTAAGVVSAIGR